MSNYDFESAPERAISRAAASAADRLAHSLSGFRLSECRRPARRRYPAPPLPPGFNPRHRARLSRFEPLPEERRGLERHRLSAGQRAEMIGEQRLPQAAGPDPPAPQTAAQADVSAVAAGDLTATATLRGRTAGPEPVPPGTAPGRAPSQPVLAAGSAVKTEHPVSAAAAASQQTSADADRLREVRELLAEADSLGSAAAAPALKPFARDPDKQARYEQFLKLSAANRKGKASS